MTETVDTAPSRFYGVVLRVTNLAHCRSFYEEVVGLGPPAIASNFWVEYEIPPDHAVLALRHDPSAAARDSQPDCRVCWCLQPPDLDAFVRRMEANNVEPQTRVQLPSGRRVVGFADPEGNCFMAIAPGKRPA